MAERQPRSESDPSDFHEEEALDRPFDRGLARRLFSYVGPYRGQVALALFLVLVTTVLSLLGPVLVKEAIDGPLSGGDAPAGLAWMEPWVKGAVSGPIGWLTIIVLLYSVILVFQFAARYLHTVVTNVTGQSVTRDLRMEVFKHLQSRPLAYQQKSPVGRLVTRVTSDIEALNELFTAGVVTFISDLLTVVGIVCIMFYFNAWLALIALSVTPVLLAVTFVFRAMARKYYREIRRRIAHLNAFSQESISGMDIIQISRREDAQAARYQGINDHNLEAWLKSVFWYSVFFPIVDVLMMISVALVVHFSGAELLSPTAAITFGEFFLFWIYLNKVFTPIRGLAERYNTLQAAMAASERIFGILDSTEGLPRPEEVMELRPLEKGIRFENVSFSYDAENADNPVLRSVSFDVRKGETVALVGATGAGKSTIINLLLRFYDPTSGRVLVDGVDAREFDLDEHRLRFGLVLQDVAIFSRTVQENIDLDRQLEPELLRRAAEQVHVDGVVARLEDGYDEAMKERGRTLSSGERQLLAFARALAGDPEVLVLDEATSHIDTETEALIQDALRRLIAGRTSVVVAHRLSTIRHADRILVLHHGELREEGTHEELLARGGIYARLHRLQFGEDLDHGAA